MERRYLIILVLLLIGLLVTGCSRSRNPEAGKRGGGPLPAAEQADVDAVQSEETSVRPPKEPRRILPPETRDQSRPVSAAFFAVKDMGFSENIPDVFDYEIGRLERRIPESLDACFSLLGGSLPEENLAPEWRGHLNRQSELFGQRPVTYRVSAEGAEGALNPRFKAVWDDRMVIGFLRARIGEDGRYLLEDLGINSTLEMPYPKMEIPPPLADTLY